MDFIVNYYFDFKNYVFEDGNFQAILEGFWLTIKLSLLAGALGLTWGLILSVLRQLPGRALAPIRWLTIAHIDVFRGIPLLLVLLLVSGISVFGAPIGGEVLPKWLATPNWLGEGSPFWYGVFGLTLTYGAYMAEVYRAGIESIPHGQMEAARSLGMSHGQAMRYVVVPQAVRRVIPPLLNDFIALMKDTSLVVILGATEVVQAGRDIQSETFNGSGLTMAAILFLIVTIPLARLVDWLIARERRRVGRGGGGGDDDLMSEVAFAGGTPPSVGGGAGAGAGA